MPILQCLPPTQPQMDCQTTTIYGAPKKRLGRSLPDTPLVPIPISAIAVHCLRDSYDGYLSKVCIGATTKPVGCHGSMHYVLDAETGRLTSLVPEADMAWAFQEYRSNFPATTPLNCCVCPTPCSQPPCPADLCVPETYVGWPVLAAQFPNLAADFYTISIGITAPSRPEMSVLDGVDCCLGPYGLSDAAYRKLIQLLAWIEYRYDDITVDAQHIAFHDNIVFVEDGCAECPCGANGTCLVCDISAYCERCTNPADPTITASDAVEYVLGISSSGCRVKIALCDLKALLDECPVPLLTAQISGTLYLIPLVSDCPNKQSFVTQQGGEISLYTNNGGVFNPAIGLIETVQTDVNGDYTFTGLAAGTYWVYHVPIFGYCTPNPQTVVLTEAEHEQDIDFGMFGGT